MKHTDIIDFWFSELKPEQWWKKDESLDSQIKERFLKIYQKAIVGELYGWRSSPQGRLAEIIVIDQFARNIFRGKPESFLYDSLALILSQEAVRLGSDKELTNSKKSFLYMPFMHSESIAIHEQAVKLYSQDGLEFNLEFEHKHKKIIDKFGRYPHRNQILGRESTEQEKEFLLQPDSSF
jgi:uncharacterized protein (DUF924 family)